MKKKTDHTNPPPRPKPVAAFFIFLTLAFLYLWQAADSKELPPLLFAAAAFAAAITTGIYKFQRLDPALIVYAYFSLYPGRYYNFTPALLLALALKGQPREKQVRFVAAYGMDVIVCLLLKDLTASHAIIHAIGAGAVFCYILLEAKPGEIKLDLLPDEINILTQLEEGADFKALEGISRSHANTKLKAARERNGLATNRELRDAFHKMQTRQKQDETGQN